MSYPYQVRSLEAYQEAYKKSVEDPEGFWADVAGNFLWHKKWDKVLNWNFSEPKIEWFVNGKLLVRPLSSSAVWSVQKNVSGTVATGQANYKECPDHFP